MMAPLPVLKFQEQSLIILHDPKKSVSKAAEIYTLRRGLF